MDSILPIISVLGYWAIVWDTTGGFHKSGASFGSPLSEDHLQYIWPLLFWHFGGPATYSIPRTDSPRVLLWAHGMGHSSGRQYIPAIYHIKNKGHITDPTTVKGAQNKAHRKPLGNSHVQALSSYLGTWTEPLRTPTVWIWTGHPKVCQIMALRATFREGLGLCFACFWGPGRACQLRDLPA